MVYIHVEMDGDDEEGDLWGARNIGG